MTENFENRLVAASSRDAVKKARQIIKNGCLLCSYEDNEGNLFSLCSGKKGRLEKTKVFGLKKGDYNCDCTCSGGEDRLCCHGIAAILHYSRFGQKKKTVIKENPAKYAGLKYEGIPELISQTLTPPKAEIIIRAESAFPHVPSKWERALLSVKLRFGEREYIGSLNNLRQLHFGKNMSASLKINYFSLQDRQIIRFLAVSAESEDSKLALNAEQTAEFFHCLAGFNNFLRGGEKVVVHRETAEPVMICEEDEASGNYVLSPAVSIKGAVLPLKSPKVITGRSGCWLGLSGEYWWMPAAVDISWLRNFLRAALQPCDAQSAQMLINGNAHFPIKVIASGPSTMKQEKCNVLYSGTIDRDNSLVLDIGFEYQGRIFSPDGSRVSSADGAFIQRDTETEKGVLEELRRFGFEREKGGTSRFRLKAPEATGYFLDIIIPEWLRQKKNFLMSSELAAASRGGCGLPKLAAKCRVADESSHEFQLKCLFESENIHLNWRDILAGLRKNRIYFSAGNRMAKAGTELKNFIEALSDAVIPDKQNPEIIKISRFSIPYWVKMASGLPGAVPPEFHKHCLAFESVNEAMNTSLFPRKGTAKRYNLKCELRNYQKQGIVWMKKMTEKGFNLILADEMGLGKTVQTLALLAADKNSAVFSGIKNGPSLIVCPTSLIENWEREASKFVPAMKVLAIRGPKRQRLWKRVRNYDIVITSYNLARRDLEIFRNIRFNFQVLDEAQHIKNPSTANAKTCKSIQARHRVVLTGTPVENSPEDLWSIFDYLHPGMLGSYNHFKNQFSGIHEDSSMQKRLSARVSPYILRRKKAEVYSELPPKIEQTLYCEMNYKQKQLYEQFLNIGRRQCEDIRKENRKPTLEILTTLLRLRQICCHPGLLPKDLNEHIRVSAKTELMEELLLQSIDSGHKILLFSQFTSLLDIIRRWLDRLDIKYEYLDGSTKNRMECVDNFNDSSEIPVFLLSLKAGGTGLNLTSADTVIIYDPWWNPAVEAQAADRTHRIGQTKTVNSIKLVVKNSIEEKILELQKKKSEIFQSLIENPSGAVKKLDIKDFEYLFK